MADYNSGAAPVTAANLEDQVLVITQQISDLTNKYNTAAASYSQRGESPPTSLTTEFNKQRATLQAEITNLSNKLYRQNILDAQIESAKAKLLTSTPDAVSAEYTKNVLNAVSEQYSALEKMNTDAIRSADALKYVDSYELKKIALDSMSSPKNSISPSTKRDVKDNRFRLKAMPGQEDSVYGDGILSIIHPGRGGTTGLIFPYTPQITVNHSTDYGTTSLVHTNEDIDHYIRTPSVTISLTAKFTIQNQREGRYALAALHFLRTVSKMHFGQTDENRGLPPPVLMFSGYGEYMFNDLPVIVKSHTYSFDDHTDTVLVSAINGSATLPVIFSIQIELKVQQTPNRMRTVFNLDDFRNGSLMKNGKGWI